MWYPDAIARPIPPGSNDPAIIPVGCILHVAISGADSLFPYFDGPSGGIESTWYVRYDGTIEQYRDTEREADANGDGNSWIGSDGRRYGLHSIETAGFEHGEWTDAQLQSIKRLLAWDAREHDWPLQVIGRWNGKGVGYHVQFGAPGPYTNVRGKTCPGPDRVQQFNNIITPWLESGGPMSATGPEQWDNADWDTYKAHMDDYHQHRQIYPSPSGDTLWSERHYRRWFGGRWREARGQAAQILANQQAIMAAQGVEVDEQELAQQISAVLVPAVIEALPDTGLTEAEVTDASERAVRAVLGSLDAD